jgi:hypothetical protein
VVVLAVSAKKGTNVNKDELATEIIRIIAQPGAEATDGECIDEILSLLESEGYPIPRMQVLLRG